MDNSKPHVIMLAYFYPPHQEMGALRPFRFKKYLERMGYRCHVITASPQSQPSPDVTVVPDELGTMWESSETAAAIPGARIELLLRFFFPGHIGFRWSRAAMSECRRIVAVNPKTRFVLFSTYPPIGALFAGVGQDARLPWIADFRDPLAALVFGDRRWYVRVANRLLERRVLSRASALIANTQAAADAWKLRYPRAQIHAIYNGYDPEQAPSPRSIPVRDHKLIVHAGTIYHLRNPNLVIESMARLRAKETPEAMATKLLFLGTTTRFDEANWILYEQAQREGWLHLQPAVERAEAQRIVEQADGLLIVQPHTAVQVPGKLFEYICVGRPVLAITPRDSAIENVLTCAAVPHVCLYPDEPTDTSDGKLLNYLRLPSTAAPINQWFRTNFNAELQTRSLAHIIDAVASPGK